MKVPQKYLDSTYQPTMGLYGSKTVHCAASCMRTFPELRNTEVQLQKSTYRRAGRRTTLALSVQACLDAHLCALNAHLCALNAHLCAPSVP